MKLLTFDKLNLFRSLLLSFIPISLVMGTFISNSVYILFLLVSFVYYIYNKKNIFYFRKDTTYKIFLIFAFYLIFNFFVNLEISIITFNRYLTVLSFIFFSFSVYQIIKDDEFNYKVFFYINIILIIFLIFHLFFQYIFGFDVFGNDIFFEYRLTGPFGKELVPGSFMSKIFFPIFILGIFYISDNKNKLSYIYLFPILAFISVLLTGERTALILFYIGIILTTIFLKKYKYYRIFYLTVLVLIPIILLNFNFYTAKRIQAIFKDNVQVWRVHDKHSQISSLKKNVYYKHYKNAYMITKENPFFGVGLKGFRISCQKYENILPGSCTTHPHNMILEVTSELGLIGLFILSLLILNIYYNCSLIYLKFTKKNENIFTEKNNLILICMIGFFISCLLIFFPFRTSGSFFSSWNGLMIWFNLSFLAALTSKLKKVSIEN